MRQDLREAVRALRTSPTVSLVVVLSLALGIGANTAIFSIVDDLLLESLPVREPERLAVVKKTDGDTIARLWASHPLWRDLRDREIFEDAFAWSSTRFDLSGGGETELVDGLWVTGRFFDALGVGALMGRTLREADDVPGGGPDGAVAVISHGFWQRRFGGDPDVIGRSITVERVPFSIVGVTPPSFFGPEVGNRFDIALATGTEPLLRGRRSRLDNRFAQWLQVMVRLRAGQSVEGATARLRELQPAIRDATLPSYRFAEQREGYLREPLTAAPASSGVSPWQDRYRRPLVVLLVIVGLVLLIACGNVAHLMLAKVTARQREMGIRAALGASRLRISRGLLTESLLLSGAASVAALFVGTWASRLLVRELSTSTQRVSLDLALDGRILAFTAAVGLVTAVVFGTAPAWRASRTRAMESLRSSGPGVVTGRARTGSVLVVAQVAFSLLLLLAAFLFIGTFSALANLELGFQPERTLLVYVDAGRSGLERGGLAKLSGELRDAVTEIPGVRMAAASAAVPIGFSAWVTWVEPPDTASSAKTVRIHKNEVTPGWFETIGTTLVAGRDFGETDRAAAPTVAIVNRAFVRRFMADAVPLGRRVRAGSDPNDLRSVEIVGVVEDTVYRSIKEPVPPTIYLPAAQSRAGWPTTFFLVVRPEAGSFAAVPGSIAAAVERVNPALSLTVRAWHDQVKATFNRERVLAKLAAAFAALALGLVAVGLYGVTAHGVRVRRGEIAIRVALGAGTRRVVETVLGRIVYSVALGIALGSLAGLWAVELVQKLVFGLPPRDPSLFAAAAVFLAAVAVVAGLIPARRASALDPAAELNEG